ncbi:unnamed protein product [Amoebophrya sp. A120]|nr:unnamed protein product [Amoebophrya sp. A120]|eukprot:GSA120T00013287001.1
MMGHPMGRTMDPESHEELMTLCSWHSSKDLVGFMQGMQDVNMNMKKYREKVSQNVAAVWDYYLGLAGDLWDVRDSGKHVHDEIRIEAK